MVSIGWRLTETAPGALEGPGGLRALQAIDAAVPGTVAGALRAAGEEDWRTRKLDGRDWWFHTAFESEPADRGEEVRLCLDGLATLAEVYLNGELVHRSETMFRTFAIEVGDRLRTDNELAICFRALEPRLTERRKPRARWRTRLVSSGNLRFFRTMLLGRAPGFAPGPAVVGPWRPVRLERRRGVVVDRLTVRANLEQGRGRVRLEARLRGLDAAAAIDRARCELTGPDGVARVGELQLSADGEGAWRCSGELSVERPERWWPHTHGAPALYAARLLIGDEAFDAGKVGFRDLSAPADIERDGLALTVNGTPVFARGAVWTPLDLAAPDAPEPELRRVLGAVVEAGLNMLRVPGIGCYESDAFYDLCDELGILVWQDFMFANLDYPESDPEFMTEVEREARQVLARLAGRPSLAVLCGGSEVAQQVAMLGLDPGLANGPLYAELLPALVAEAEVQAPYIPSAPFGGELPFRTDRGVANYYGVGAYRRGLEDCRRSEVKFAAECLAFSNVPDEAALATIEAPGGLVAHHPAWKAGVPRDAGAGWDFEDIRDHYFQLLFGLEPVATRSSDHDRYLELSRAVTGEVMAEVFGEWRREASPCGGGLVLWLTDLMPGAGWGVLDHRGEPKAAYHHLRRALAPVAVWGTDEGLGGMTAHIANDGGEPFRGTLRVGCYRDLEVPIGEATIDVELPAHGGCAHDVEALLGRFVDIGWAYRFGPPAQDLVVLSLAVPGPGGDRLVSQSFRFPVGRPTRRESAAQLGLSASLREVGDDTAELTLATRRLAYGVRVRVPGFDADDDAFSVEPGHGRTVTLRRRSEASDAAPAGSVSALNLFGRIAVAPQ
jgi:beta-mannosidase